MENTNLTLYLEINNSNFVFFVNESDDQNNFKVIYEFKTSAEGIENKRISDLKKISYVIKENIYTIEQKLNFTFKEIVLILDNFDPTFINLGGFKKLNSSQVLRENITYILNTLKSCVDTVEINKAIIHIFNSKFCLDNKKIENLPIGLFGDFYSHELSFTLLNKNNYKNLNSIFKECNLKIKKILIKSFIQGANLSNKNKNIDTFFHIKLNENYSKIFYFENNCLKIENNFSFGTDIIIKDICKITSLKEKTVKSILNKIDFQEKIFEQETVNESLFGDDNYRKIKKKLIYDIIFARVKEISELILFNNINFQYFNKICNNVFLEIDSTSQLKCLRTVYKKSFSIKNISNFEIIDDMTNESILNTANELVHYGWKKEAIPISHSKKSLIARFFDTLFG